ncbi:MAG: hypothetical protein ACE5H5_01525 [Nitrospinota bacterium]
MMRATTAAGPPGTRVSAIFTVDGAASVASASQLCALHTQSESI